jgi:hypothetical protein
MNNLSKLSLLKSVNKHVGIFKCNSEVTSSIKQLKSHKLTRDNIVNESSITLTNEKSVVRCLNMNMNKIDFDRIEEEINSVNN